MNTAPFPYDGPPELLPVIAGALESVVDPEVALDIVAVGLVYGARVAGKRVDVQVTMTTAACPVTDVIVADIEEALDRVLDEGFLIHVELVWEPPWTPERLSNRAKVFMGW